MAADDLDPEQGADPEQGGARGGPGVVAVLLAFGGLAAATAVVGAYGFSAVGRSLLAVGWSGFLLILAAHAATFLLLGAAWWAVTPGGLRPRRPAGEGEHGPVRDADFLHHGLAFVWARLVRDAAGDVLPFSQIGGYVLGARAAVVAGLPAAMAFASTIVDVATELLAQIGYTGLGLGLLSRHAPEFPLVRPALAGLAIGTVVAGGFMVVQRHAFGAVERLGYRVAGRWLPAAAAGTLPVQGSLHDIYGRPARIMAGVVLHLAGWLALAGEAWLGLRLLGAPLAFGAVVALESTVYALRSVGFAIPNALGVQEGAYLMVGGALGLAPQTALALSLLKRARDVAAGVPALLAWQAAEAARARRRGAMGEEPT